MANPSLFLISPETACTYTQNWRNMDPDNPLFIKAFTVKIEELQNILSEMTNLNANAIRIYLGQDSTSLDATGTDKKLVMVAVAGFDPDASPSNPGFDIVLYANPDNLQQPLSGCYDFTYPCPDTCAKTSPLLIGANA
jgi:hypothetical protein